MREGIWWGANLSCGYREGCQKLDYSGILKISHCAVPFSHLHGASCPKPPGLLTWRHTPWFALLKHSVQEKIRGLLIEDP